MPDAAGLPLVKMTPGPDDAYLLTRKPVGGIARWWIYQRERFPVAGHGLLIAAFSISAVCFSALSRGAGLPGPAAVAVAFASSFLFFLLLRITDEFKDAEEDAAHRPYRPVPRGLVSFHELRILAGAAMLAQAVLALLYDPGMLILLFLVWGYLLLMTYEFFVPSALKRHPVHYLWTHMLIMPLIDFYVTACDWRRSGRVPSGLGWLLLLSFLNGVVIELGRKIRPECDEERGVETYSFLWGRGRAVCAWLAAMAAAGVAAVVAATRIDFGLALLACCCTLFAGAALSAFWFLRQAAPGSGKVIENMSGLWTFSVYMSCGIVPMLIRSVGAQ